MKETRKMQTAALVAERTKLLIELEALKNKISGLELAIELIAEQAIGSEKTVQNTTSLRESGITAVIRGLLDEVGSSGLNAGLAVSIAASKGIELNRASVSSLLSRMKREGIVVYKRKRYLLKEKE